MITTLVRRVAPLFVLGVLLLGSMRTQRIPPARADLWFHLRFGQGFLDGWSLRGPGHLGPFDTADWVPTQWLPQQGMAWMSTHWGVDNVVWAAGVVVLIIVGAMYASCRSVAPPLPAAIAVTLGTLAASPGFSARPQLLSYLFVVITTSAWLATWRDGRPRYWLIGLAWLWPMCHGMWPVGISISVAAVVGLALERRVERATLTRLAIIPVASVVVAGLTPILFDSYRTLLVAGSRTTYFTEWGAPDFTSPHAVVLAIMATVVVVAGLRSQPVAWTHAMLTVLAMAWALYSFRTTMVAALILAPLVAGALARLVPDTAPPTRRERLVVTAMTALACVALLPMVKAQPTPLVVPAWVDARLDQLPDGARVLDDWDTGAYVLHRHPDLALVMHGYGDVFTDAEIGRNYDLVQLAPGWDRTVLDLDVDVALLDPDTRLGYAVQHDLGWTVVEADDAFVLLTPPGAPTSG